MSGSDPPQCTSLPSPYPTSPLPLLHACLPLHPFFPPCKPDSPLPPPHLLLTCPPLAMKLCTRWGPCSDRLLSNSGPVGKGRKVGGGGIRV